jgi:hypothetical protein
MISKVAREHRPRHSAAVAVSIHLPTGQAGRNTVNEIFTRQLPDFNTL